MLRVVLDPVVMLRGLLNPHSLCGRLLSDYSGRYRAVFSDDTVKTLRFLLVHPFLAGRFPSLLEIRPSRLAHIFQYAERVRVPTEPETSVFITLARSARADYLICEDHPLLSECRARGIPVLDTSAFLAMLDPDLYQPTS